MFFCFFSDFPSLNLLDWRSVSRLEKTGNSNTSENSDVSFRSDVSGFQDCSFRKTFERPTKVTLLRKKKPRRQLRQPRKAFHILGPSHSHMFTFHIFGNQNYIYIFIYYILYIHYISATGTSRRV